MFALKEILQECKNKNYKIGDYCEGLLIEKGYIKNDCFGWERLEVLQQFGLDPNMKAIPSKLIDEVDQKGSKKTGKKILVASDEWLNYMRFKREKNNQELIAEKKYDSIAL